MVEDPLLALQEWIVRICSEVWNAIDIPGNCVRLPVDCKDMIVIRNWFAQIVALACVEGKAMEAN